MHFIVPDICNQNGRLFQSRYNGLSTLLIKMVQPSIPESRTRSTMSNTHFYCLYSIMTGSKFIAGSPSKV